VCRLNDCNDENIISVEIDINQKPIVALSGTVLLMVMVSVLDVLG